MDRPTLQQLDYLVALAETQNFSRAAAACFVSQPALSSQIRELERRLGTVLVERTSRGAHLTPAGETAVRRARQVLQQVDDLAAGARDEHARLSGVLTIGAIPTMAPYLLPRVVATVTEHFPDAVVRLHERRTDELVDGVRRGALELGLCAVPVEDAAGLTTVELARDPFLLAVGERHPLARGTEPLSLDVLADESVLLLEDGHCLRAQALDVCAVAGAPTRSLHDTSLASLVQLVAAGQGVTLLPRSAAGLEGRRGNGVVLRRFVEPAPHRTIGMVWRGSSPRDDTYRELAALVPLDVED